LLRLLDQPVQDTIDRALMLREKTTPRLDLGRIKMVIDGSIQGFSARLRWPGYYNGVPNGLWYTAPEQLRQALTLGLSKGVHIHMHTNGDEATDLVLDTMTDLSRSQPLADHRYTLQHCQMANEAQFRRIKALGLCTNLFANHTYYWGDEHYTQTVGPERAERMNACATALRVGVPLAIHSDAPVTPLGPLFTAWCAVNRLTSSGRLLGAEQRISVQDALYAITLGAAYTLKLDDQVGSIETGKQADFCILDEDPTEISADKLKDVSVWGTVLAGKVFEAATISSK
jgi:predicted amidohydrolase YtcJ